MVDFEALKKLVSTNSFRDLVNQQDITNIQSIIENNPDFFNQKRLLPGVMFIQEANNKVNKERSKYGFRVSQPTGVGQWQDTKGVIYNSKFLNYLINEKNVIFDSEGIVEEIIFCESVPLFSESIEYITTFISEVLKTEQLTSLSEFLHKIDGLSDEYEGHDYFVRQIFINYRNNSAKLWLYKETNNNERLKELVDHIATNKTSRFWQNANGIADCCQDRFYDPSTLTGVIIEITKDGLSDYVGYNFQPSPENADKYKETSNIILGDAIRWDWMNPEYSTQLSEWSSYFGFNNIFISFQVETISNQVNSRVIYGNSGFR